MTILQANAGWDATQDDQITQGNVKRSWIMSRMGLVRIIDAHGDLVQKIRFCLSPKRN